MVRGGTTTITFDPGVMERLGLRIDDVDEGTSSSTERYSSQVFPIDVESTLTFSVLDGNVMPAMGGQILHFGELSVAAPQKRHSLYDPIIAPAGGELIDRFRATDAGMGEAGGLVLERVLVGFDQASQTLTIHSGSLHLSPAWAEAMGDTALAEHALGRVSVHAVAEWIGGTKPIYDTTVPPTDEWREIGPDVTFCQLYDLGQYGREGDIVGLSEATTSWNIGDADLMWFGEPDVEHPFIIMNLFRLKDDQFEQIGQSWVKHGFYALGSHQCGGPACTYESGHSQGDWLGQGCTDTYSAPLNAAQDGLGPRYEVSPWKGTWRYAGSHFSQGTHSHDDVEHRLQVYDADLDPALNPGASYYAGSFYATLDDVNAMNSAAWKPVTPYHDPGPPYYCDDEWCFTMSDQGTYPNIGFAIDAWTGAQQTVLAQEVPPVEFVSPDGRCVLVAKATDQGEGIWHYEYALFNIDMDRKVGLFSIPVTPGTIVTNVGFHAVEHHGEEEAGYSNDAWSWVESDGALTWDTLDNPVRWGTLYNFRFDANVPPSAEDVTVTLGMFDPGTPEVVTGGTVGPEQSPPDCNNNGIEDSCDVDCGEPGGPCDVPGCGGSEDCNSNGIPDECEADCNSSGVPDDCDIAAGTSEDCDSNGVPDECDPDSDGDGVPDNCDVCPGFDDNTDSDGDGVADGCDTCPGFDDGADADGDGVADACDNCPDDVNPGQEDEDEDGIGNVCDPDYCNPLVMDEHFATDPPGWTVESIDLIDGQWEWGDPAGGGDRYDPPDDFDGDGTCYLTDNQDGNSDVDGGPTRLSSPILDLSGGNATLEYAYWFGWDDGAGDDSLMVEVSTDAGGSWTEVAIHNDVGVEEWRTNSLLLDDFVTPSATMQIRFSAKDNPNDSIVEAGVDAVRITAYCFPDCNTNDIPDDQDIAQGTSQDCNTNSIPDECDISSGISQDCNTNSIPDECDIAGGTSEDHDGSGIPDECEVVGDGVRGGLLWDKWWAVISAAGPSGEHPLYPPEGQQSGSTTYRCKECHGWDYKGADGAYGSGSHYTGIPGVFGSTMTPEEKSDIIKLDSVPNGHGFGGYGLNDEDIWDLVEFLRTLVIDTDQYIDPNAQFIGDPDWGQVYYEFGGSIACVWCHGWDGTQINFGTPENPVWVGTVAVNNPWEMLHKTRIGQPGTPMPAWLVPDGTDQQAADIGRYSQVAFPIECTTGAEHCDDGDPCNGQETCLDGYCQAGVLIDCNSNGVHDLCDPFADFHADGSIDLADYASFHACLTAPCEDPPCSPALYVDDCCVIADFERDGDVDVEDFARFQRSLGDFAILSGDGASAAIPLDSTVSHRGRRTCGGCHGPAEHEQHRAVGVDRGELHYAESTCQDIDDIVLTDEYSWVVGEQCGHFRRSRPGGPGTVLFSRLILDDVAGRN